MLSIEAQIKELKDLALNQGLNVVDVYFEAKSAKAPGRPVFNKLIERLYKTPDTGVICWKLDRLARNPVDGGQIIWSVEQGRIKEIATPGRSFTNRGDDKFWMQLEFGIAKKYVDDLSDNVKRGNRAKLEKGILPGTAPIGYKNDKETKTIITDPDRFRLVRRIWDVVLQGNYSVQELLRTAEEEWGLTTLQHKNIGGSPLTRSGLYRLLSNPFYYGAIQRKGELYPGSHEPMITQNEFESVQKLLGRPQSRPKRKSFAYTGMIRCSECGSMITAEEKTNRYGYHYTYYRCAKKKGGINNRCGQKYVRLEDLENQIVAFLDTIRISEKYFEWALSQLKNIRDEEMRSRGQDQESLDRSLKGCQRKLDNLLQMKLRDLLTDEEYISQKSALVKTRMKLETKIVDAAKGPQLWFEPSERLLFFLTLAKDSFRGGDDDQKREILQSVSSNLLLKDKNLLIEAKKPFKIRDRTRGNSTGLGLVDDVRTFFADPSRHFHIPVLKSSH